LTDQTLALGTAVDFDGPPGMIALLLELGAPIDETSPQGFTALLVATAGGRHEIVRLLLGAGADIGLTTVAGHGVIGLFLRRDGIPDPEHLRELLARGARIDREAGPLLPMLLRKREPEDGDADDDHDVVVAELGLGAPHE
jgi:hypothetical protein